jgi:hypothetical protein
MIVTSVSKREGRKGYRVYYRSGPSLENFGHFRIDGIVEYLYYKAQIKKIVVNK